MCSIVGVKLNSDNSKQTTMNQYPILHLDGFSSQMKPTAKKMESGVNYAADFLLHILWFSKVQFHPCKLKLG